MYFKLQLSGTPLPVIDIYIYKTLANFERCVLILLLWGVVLSLYFEDSMFIILLSLIDFSVTKTLPS